MATINNNQKNTTTPTTMVTQVSSSILSYQILVFVDIANVRPARCILFFFLLYKEPFIYIDELTLLMSIIHHIDINYGIFSQILNSFDTLANNIIIYPLRCRDMFLQSIVCD